MNCVICGQGNVDGAIDTNGDYVCVDCWADGSAACEGRIAMSYAPPDFYLPITYPAETQKYFIGACNGEYNQ